jgi:hypothetical protein
VTAVPFPTAVLATYLGTPDERIAALFYNGVFVVIAIFFNLTWRYAVSRRLLDESMLMSATTISRQYAFGPLMYILCFIVAWFDVRASIALSAALAIFFALPPGLMRKNST